MCAIYTLQARCTTEHSALMSDKSTTVTVRLSHELAEKLKRLAEAEERTVSQYVRLLIKRHVETKTAK
jgi:predicted DNA binding CopG/RHH family protein